VVFGAGPLVQALPAGDGGGFGLVEEDHQVTEDVYGLPCAGLLWAPGASLLGPDLCHDLGGVGRVARVTNPMSAERAISRYGTLACPRAAMTGWPCGGRGAIDGPFTENQRPSKSM
jgi:hypothetical protein